MAAFSRQSHKVQILQISSVHGYANYRHIRLCLNFRMEYQNIHVDKLENPAFVEINKIRRIE